MSNRWMGPSLATAILLAACSRDSVAPELSSPPHPTLSEQASDEIQVSSLETLYSAVNDPTNAGKRIVVASGTYMLDGTQAHGGRIELQKDMTLAGQLGQQDAVVIDASNLSAANLTDGTLVTGAVRMGRGSNTVEWVTVQNAVKGAASITTDLVLAGATTATIAHVTASGSPRGFDIRNFGAAAAGRVLEVSLTDNELANNAIGASQGMRVANLQGAHGASIHATLSGNYVHGSITGCLASNVATQSATVEIESKGDRFEGNGNGCVLIGGLGGASAARGNLVRFAAHTSRFEHNTGGLGPAFPNRGGIAAYGGASVAANGAFDNTLELDLHSAKIDDNDGPDIAAWGAISSAALPAGTGNVASIVLRGASKKATVNAVDSDPAEPAGTNHVTIVR